MTLSIFVLRKTKARLLLLLLLLLLSLLLLSSSFLSIVAATNAPTNAELLDALDVILEDVLVDAKPKKSVHRGGLLWKDLQVTTANSNTTLLHSCSGFVPNGCICAVLGPSGAGKTSFLHALGGRSRHVVDGTVVYSSMMTTTSSPSHEEPNENEFCVTFPDPSKVAWLSQSDYFFSMLTPRETLILAAFLQLPRWDVDERERLVQMQLEALGLDSVSDSCVGADHDATFAFCAQRLSGGEKRRLSVALELLTHEQLFLLADEPTSGLDAALAMTVLNLIRLQARQLQIPAVASLHQPRSSAWHHAIDYVVVLAPGGHTVYCGPRRDCLSYFASLGYSCPELTNPAEFLVDLVSINNQNGKAAQDRTRILYLAQAFRDYQNTHWKDPPFFKSNRPCPPTNAIKSGPQRSASLGRREVLSPQQLRHAVWYRPIAAIRRLGALFRRSWRQNMRNLPMHLFRLVASVGNAILLAKIFPSVGMRGDPPKANSVADRVALLSFGAINMAFLAFTKAVTVFAEERPVVHREQTRKQYSPLEYLSAKVLAELPLDSFFAAVFTSTLKYFCGVWISWNRLTATFALLTLSSASLGYLIGGWSPPSGKLATTASVPILVILMVVGIINPSGVDPNHPQPSIVRALKTVSPFRYAIEALCLGEYPGMDFTSKASGFWGGWFQKVRNLPRMGAFALVQNGEQVLDALGLKDQTYARAMRELAMLSARFLALGWLGLQVQLFFSQARRPTNHKHRKPETNENERQIVPYDTSSSASTCMQMPVLRGTPH